MRRRSYRGKPPVLADAGWSLLILLAGVLLGVVSKWAYLHAAALSEQVLQIALWIFLASAVALGSRSPLRAALHVLLLLGGMEAAYYIAAFLMGVRAQNLLFGWVMTALLSPVAGALVWYARGEDRRAWLVSGLVLAAQIGGTLLLFRKIRVTDGVVMALTAVMLFAGKVKNLRKLRYRKYRR